MCTQVGVLFSGFRENGDQARLCCYFRASNVSGERSPFDGSCCGSGYHTVDSTPLDTPEEAEVPKYRVVMLGDSGVGKTALVSQFMTSEYMNTYDASLGECRLLLLCYSQGRRFLLLTVVILNGRRICDDVVCF